MRQANQISMDELYQLIGVREAELFAARLRIAELEAQLLKAQIETKDVLPIKRGEG